MQAAIESRTTERGADVEPLEQAGFLESIAPLVSEPEVRPEAEELEIEIRPEGPDRIDETSTDPLLSRQNIRVEWYIVVLLVAEIALTPYTMAGR